MSLIVAFVLLILGFILLTKGADYFIENSAAFAEDNGISPHIVGVTIVAFGTSLPELLVSLISSFYGHNDLAFGNIVGSNISNLGLVLAISRSHRKPDPTISLPPRSPKKLEAPPPKVTSFLFLR